MVVYTYNPSTQEAVPEELVSSRPAWAAQQGPVSNPTIPTKDSSDVLDPKSDRVEALQSLPAWVGRVRNGRGGDRVGGGGGAQL